MQFANALTRLYPAYQKMLLLVDGKTISEAPEDYEVAVEIIRHEEDLSLQQAITVATMTHYESLLARKDAELMVMRATGGVR